MHKTVFEEQMPSGGKPTVFGFHSHVLSDIPEDSDIFYALTRKAQKGEWIATPKYVYEITPEYSIRYLGKTEEIVTHLKQGNCIDIPASMNFCAENTGAARLAIISHLQRLIGDDASSVPLEIIPALKNARCQGGRIFLTLESTVRNVGDKDLLLNEVALGNWIQLRFADSKADLDDDKYEKIVFVAMDPSGSVRNDLLTSLAPGKTIVQSREVLVAGVNPEGKNFAQLLYITWFDTMDVDSEAINRFPKSALLYTEPVLTKPIPFTFDEELIKTCLKK